MATARYVICKLCGERFDRNSIEYVKVSSTRYAHASCALRNWDESSGEPKPQVVNPLDFVDCIYCKQTFDKSKEPFNLFSNGKYAHKKCFELEQKRELTEEEKLEKYIMDLYKVDYINGRIRKQIKDYVENYGYTYSGIRKALVYWYEVKGHPIEQKYTGAISIIPHCYDNAYRYYYSIWEAQQQQHQVIEANIIDAYVPKDVIVKIPVPKRQEKKRKLFTFLDMEGE